MWITGDLQGFLGDRGTGERIGSVSVDPKEFLTGIEATDAQAEFQGWVLGQFSN